MPDLEVRKVAVTLSVSREFAEDCDRWGRVVRELEAEWARLRAIGPVHRPTRVDLPRGRLCLLGLAGRPAGRVRR